LTPNPEQQVAIQAMTEHLRTKDSDPYFRFDGPAGCGKTWSSAFVWNDFKRKAVITAPTNKAVRVIRDALSDQGLKMECRTIFSLLGLQMQANGEIKELAKPEDPIDLADVYAIQVDERSMVGSQLWHYIEDASKRFPHIRWIFSGDQFQLPPVGEVDSPTTKIAKAATLVKVMRQDNQILTLSVHLRDMVQKPFGPLKLNSDNDGAQGVWKVPDLESIIADRADGFMKGENKAIAWRNAVVDRLNTLVRQQLFSQPEVYPWQKDDRVTLLEPAKDLDDQIVGITDEEGAVERADLTEHPVHKEFQVWRIVMRTDSNKAITLFALHNDPKNLLAFKNRVARLAAEAKVEKRKWKDYWMFKESFHAVRHGYAITSHRAQGSTYQRAFVSWRDILANPNRAEAMRCLYVACTRPKKELYLG
jgi:ATP-dependent exoDNAse (exonuclease V) alpha subunit